MCEFYASLENKTYSQKDIQIFRGDPGDKFDLERSHVFGATITKVMTAKDKITVWGKGL